MQGNIPGGGGKLSVIMAAAVALTGLAALVAGSLGQFLRLCVQKLVECLLHAATDQFLDLPLDYFLAPCTMLLDMVCRLLSNVCMVTSFYQRPASRVYFFALFNLRNLLYLINLYCHIVRQFLANSLIQLQDLFRCDGAGKINSCFHN